MAIRDDIRAELEAAAFERHTLAMKAEVDGELEAAVASKRDSLVSQKDQLQAEMNRVDAEIAELAEPVAEEAVEVAEEPQG